MAEYPGSSSQQDPPPSSGSEAALSSTDVPEVDSTPLDYGHLFDVQSELNEAATKWKSIGIALYLKPDFLQTIETRYSSDPRACLTWILMEWLMRKYNVEKFGEPTWQRLVEVVGHPAGGADMTLARTIARRHKAESRADIAVAEEKTRKRKATGGAKKAKKITKRIKADCGADISVAEDIMRKHKTAAGAIKARKIARRHNAEEDCSEPNFQLTASLMKEMDPVTLNIKQADKVTVQAVQLFAKKVVMILHTCNKNEYWAALERLEPPTTDNQSNIQDRPITYPQVGSVIGWFAGYRAAVVRTGQGNKCRDELTNAVTKSFPNGRVIIAAGIAYANDQKRKFADVLISDQIENFVQYKKEGNEITCCGPREEVDPNVQRIFENPARDWTDMKYFICADDNRTSVAHIGCIVSAPTLIRDEVLRDQLMKHTPNAIGGEMEGWVLLELKRILKGQHNKDIEVIVIKGVADYGDLTKGDKWQWTAAKAAMDCIHYCLNKSGGTEFSGTVDPLSRVPDPPECVARYAQYLKDKYKRMPTMPDGDWPPSLGRQYTRLAMIERERKLPGAELVATMERDYIHGNIDNIVKRKKAIKLSEIFLPTEDGEQELKILMDGAPGVGKSTLSRKICKDWANGELLQQYHLVLLLPLRQTSIREAASIEGLIEADDPDLKQQVVQHIQKACGEQVLLIVDGYDELSYEDRTQNSLFLKILLCNKFPKCSVLVTSRPYASDYLQQLQSINRHVEVLGFTEEQIEHCIMENILDKAKAAELVQTLKERQDIVSLCYIPLNCAIVLYVYEKEQCTLPRSLTKLYETFILNAMKRRPKDIGNDPRSIRRLHSLANLPMPLQKQLSALSKLAYDGLVADRVVFSIDDLEAAFPDHGDLDMERNLLDLMTVFKGFISTGQELSYQFLHLTIQEFLAAQWAASQLSADGLFKFFQDHLREERYRMMLLFLAGISQLNFPSTEYLFQGTLDFNSPSHMNKVSCFFFLAHLIYESQNFILFHNLASAIVDAKLCAAWYSISPFDCLVLAYFLAWCDHTLKSLDLSYCGLTSQSLEIICRVNLEHCGTTQIEEVDLSYSNVTTKLSLLSKLPMFEQTKVLTACGLQSPEGASCVVDLLCILNMRHLTTLDISVKLGNICLSLIRFQCQTENIDSQNAVKIFRSLEHNTSLKELDLSGNSKLAEGDGWAVGCAIERMLNANSILKVLNLSGCGLDSAIATSVFRSLEHNTSLVKIDLSWNSQLVEGDSEMVGCAIERMLNVNRTLKVLNLSGCQVTDPTARHILTGLTKNTSLVKLQIEQCTLSGSYAVSLLQHVTTHPTLTRVHVGEVDVLGVGKVKMDGETIWCVMGDTIPESCVEFFRALNDSGMKISKLNVKDVTDQTAEHLAVGMAESQWVQDLTLRHSSKKEKTISSPGAVSIFRSLERNTTLQTLDLSGNSQLAKGNSEAVGCAIESMLNINRTLEVLNLHSCGLDTGVATSIFRSLEHNTSLEQLDLSGNSQIAEGDSEAVGCAVERMLNVNKTLKVLNLSGCEVTDPVAKHILTGLTKNTSPVIGLESSKLSGSCAVSLLQQTSITVGVKGFSERVNRDRNILHCAIGDTIPENCVEFFRALNNSGLKVSILNVQNLTDQTAEHFAVGLAESQSVQALKLEQCNISSPGAVSIFRSLEHNTSLEELDLSGNSQLAKGNSEAVGCAIERMLNVNRTLINLNLSGCNVTDAVVKHILTGLIKIKNTSPMTLHIESSKLSISYAVSLLQQVTTHPTLSRVHVGEVNVLGVGKIEINRGSLWCVMGDTNTENCVEFFRALNNSGLKVSKLNVENLTDQTAEHFAVALAESQSVQTLKLETQYCNISSAGAVSIFRSLEHNTTLEELHLSRNSQLTKGDSEALGCAIERILNVNRTLKILNLSRHGINTRWVHLFKALGNNTSLKKLDISENKLGMEASVALAEMLSCNKSLTELNLGRCDIPEAGLTEIARGLLQNTSLQILTLCPPVHKILLEAEIERLKKSGNFTPQSSSRLEIKTHYNWAW